MKHPERFLPVNRRTRKGRISGQSLTEFTIMAAMLLSIVVTTMLFLAVFTEYGWRILTLVGLEYP